MKKKSVFSNKEKLSKAIDESNSIKEVIEKMGLGSNGRNSETLKKYVQLYNLELPVYKATTFNNKANITDEEIFKENSSYKNRIIIKRKLLEKGFREECSKCGLPPVWNGRKLTLQLEHINGVSTDNRIENLTLLCPNCHSQTETFAGRNVKRIKKEAISNENIININEAIEKASKNNTCKSCHNGVIFNERHKLCEECNEDRLEEIRIKRANRYGVNYPNFNELKILIEDNGYVKAGKIIGVSDNALRKHIAKILPEGENIPKYITKEERRKLAKEESSLND